MAYSTVDYPFNGGQQDFTVNFALGMLERDDVTVHVEGEVDAQGQRIARAHTWVTDGIIRVTDPLPVPCTVVIERTVDKDQLEIDLTDTGPVTKDTLVRAFKQLMMNIHELLDGRADSFTGTLFDGILAIKNDTEALKNSAATSEANAAASAATALTVEDLATAAVTSTSLDAASAENSKTASAASEAAAAQSATDAANSAASASASAATATTKASSIIGKEAEAAASATSAGDSAATAATHETNAGTSAAAAATSASEAEGFATAAAGSEGAVAANATAAQSAASAAGSSATEAANSAGAASTSATAAAGSASAAATSATTAEGHKDTAAGSATAAADSASSASSSAAAATTAASQANASAAIALAAADPFVYDNVAEVLADTNLTYTAGQNYTVTAGTYLRTRKEGVIYEVAASGAGDEDISTAGGIGLYVVARDGVKNVKAFGALGDGSTDDTAAITAALTSFSDGGTVVFPAGDYRHTGVTLNQVRFVTMKAAHSVPGFVTAPEVATRLTCTSTTAHHFEFIECHGITVEGFQIGTSVVPTAGTALKFYSDGTSAGSHCIVRDCRIEHVFSGVEFDGVANSVVERNTFWELIGDYCIALVGTAKRMDQMRIIDNIMNCNVDGGSTTTDGVYIGNNTHTVFLERNSIIKCRTGYYVGGTIMPEFIRFLGSEAERCNQNGFLIENCSNIWINDAYASVNYGNGISFSSAFAGMAWVGSPDARGNSYHGILIDGSGGVHIRDPHCCGNSVAATGIYHGITVGGNRSDITVIGGKCGGNTLGAGTGPQGWGVLVNTGNGDRIRVTDVDATGNQTGGVISAASGTNVSTSNNFG